MSPALDQPVKRRPPNTRVQRTRSRSPLTRSPLGGPLGICLVVGLGLAHMALPDDLTGAVFAPGSRGVAGAIVTTVKGGDPYALATQTDGRGRYHLPLEPGRYQVSVTYPGYIRATEEVEIEADQAAVKDFILSPESPLRALPLGKSFRSYVSEARSRW
jgi:hypothetical protein